MSTLTPSRITEQGRRLYAERFRQLLEIEHTGEYVAIDVNTETPYLGSSPFEALKAAEHAHPDGFFYLVRIGNGTNGARIYGRPAGRVQFVR